MRKLTKQQLKRIIREEKRKLNEGAMGELWYSCMDSLFNMAMENGFVCCLCASKAIAETGQGPADMETCCQLIQDCCSDGMLTPIPHPSMKDVIVYAAID